MSDLQEWFAAFHFLRPQWLWLLLAIPVIYIPLRFHDDARKRWRQYIAPELLDHLIVSQHRSWRFRPIHMVCLLILLGAIALAGPTWKQEQPPFTEDKAPLVIALDLSQTMDAIDVDPTRVERAKLKLRDLLKARNGGRTALFVYAGTAHMVLPFTTAFSLFDLYLSSLATSLMPVEGKNSANALRTIDEFLKDEPVPGTILFVTDGIEANSLPTFRAFTQRENGKDDILVMGVGTSTGGPVRLSENRFLTDRGGRRVYSKLDVDVLRSLKKIDIAATTLTLDDEDIAWIQRRIQHHLHVVQQRENKMRWIDEGYWLTIPMTALGVLWFRKGWTVRWTSTALAVVFVMPAGGGGGFSWLDLWMTHDQQGRYYFERGEYQKAGEVFDDPQWKGVALERAGDYEGALNAFALSDTAEAWYNQGNALAHLGKYPEAVQAYRQALARRSPWKEAQDNLALVSSLIPKPKPKDKNAKEQEIPPDLPPDQMKFDKKNETGQKIQIKIDPKKMADIWMRNIQTSPADFLRRRFAMQATQEAH